MKKSIILSIISMAFATTAMSQEVMYIEYKDGRSVKEDISNVSNISFHHADELPADPITKDISKGLVAYYTFDNETVNDTQNHFNGFTTGCKYIDDTPNGTGKALFIKRGEQVFIPFAPINGLQNHTISLWVKDFGSGSIFNSYDKYLYAPSLHITEEVKPKFYTGTSYNDFCYEFSTDLSKYQSETWNMITLVTKTAEDQSIGTCELYINGQITESGTSYTHRNYGAVSMSIGGYANNVWADPMKIDNIRLYNEALTKEDIEAIYKREKNPAVVTISPQSLYFDKNTSTKTLIISNTTFDMREYAVSSSTNLINLSSVNSYIPAKSNKTIEVSINNRDKVDEYTNGSITFEVEGMYYAVDVQIEKGKEAKATSETVSRGLQAYYKFDDETINDCRNGYDGTIESGAFVSDTPNGKGKSLSLRRNEYASIPYAPLDGKTNHTISFWVKDFGAGKLFYCFDKYIYGPSVLLTEEMKIRLYTGTSYNDFCKTFSNLSLAKYQSDQWTMITAVTETNGDDSEGECRIYINGKRVNSGTSYTHRNSGAISMSIGGNETDPFKIDNIRLYSVALSDDEVMEIYNAERQ